MSDLLFQTAPDILSNKLANLALTGPVFSLDN